MRFLNIASGSSGNCTYIGTDNTHILIDAGISRKRILEGLNNAGISYDDIDAVLITHEHIDHISSLGVLERTREVPVFATKGTISQIKSCTGLGVFNYDTLNVIDEDNPFFIKDICLTALKTSHDALQSVCYKFESKKTRGAVVTDLGCFDNYLVDNLKNLDIMLLEANHDIRMLETGPYPYPVKQRIAGLMGHLSNEASGQFLDRLLHDNVRKILLGHISRENNTQELVKLAVKAEIDMSDSKYKFDDFDIETAYHDRCSEIVEI